MKPALRLVDVAISTAAEPSSPFSTMVPTLGYVRRPTLSPVTRRTYSTPPAVAPALTGSRATDPPTTQRSATVHPRIETAWRQEATSLIAVMRLNLDFLQSVLHGEAAALSMTALADLQQGIDRLERRLAAPPFGH